jgi:hypothetical protein
MSISVLSRYVFNGDEAYLAWPSVWSGYNPDPSNLPTTVGSPFSCFLRADGAGRWFFGWILSDEDMMSGINVRRQAGFVFRYSADSLGRGFVDESRPDAGVYSCNAGADPWLVANWPTAFAAGALVTVQHADGFASLGDESIVWTSAGFAQSQFVRLAGSNTYCFIDGLSEFFPVEGVFAG